MQWRFWNIAIRAMICEISRFKAMGKEKEVSRFVPILKFPSLESLCVIFGGINNSHPLCYWMNSNPIQFEIVHGNDVLFAVHKQKYARHNCNAPDTNIFMVVIYTHTNIHSNIRIPFHIADIHLTCQLKCKTKIEVEISVCNRIALMFMCLISKQLLLNFLTVDFSNR